MSPARTLVLIPAFNEENNIGRIVSTIRSKFPEMDVLAIDDGSTDSTAETAKNSGATVLSHAWNMGYGVALQTGYKYAERHVEYESSKITYRTSFLTTIPTPMCFSC